jgi:hypothetical protein
MPALIAMIAMIGAAIAWAIRRARRPVTEGAGRFEETPEESARD